jgi:hypothetical protein
VHKITGRARFQEDLTLFSEDVAEMCLTRHDRAKIASSAQNQFTALFILWHVYCIIIDTNLSKGINSSDARETLACGQMGTGAGGS